MFLLVACFSLSLQRNYKKCREMDSFYAFAIALGIIYLFLLYVLYSSRNNKKQKHEA